MRAGLRFVRVPWSSRHGTIECALSAGRKSDGVLFLEGTLEAEAPSASLRVGLRDDVVDLGFLRAHYSLYALGIHALKLVAEQLQHEQLAVVAAAADSSPREPGQRV